MKPTPWKGKNFAHSGRLLIVGESGYMWRDKLGCLQNPNLDSAKDVNWIISGKAWNGDRTGAKFLWKVTRALANKYDPDEPERQRAWDSCAFINYVHCTGSEDRRPTREQFIEAQQPFLELLETLRPRRVLVLGRTMWKNMPPCADGPYLRDGALQTYRLADGTLVWALALHHPTFGPKWQVYASEIETFRKLEL